MLGNCEVLPSYSANQDKGSYTYFTVTDNTRLISMRAGGALQ